MLSAFGPTYAKTIINMIEAGETVEITMDDWTTLKLTEVKEATHFLRESFGWKP